MKILLLGVDTYLGNYFKRLNQEFNLTCLKSSSRYDILKLENLNQEFDVVIDFSASLVGDIKLITNSIKTNKYVFISTTDIYESGSNIKNEKSFLKNKCNKFLKNKILLEYELKRECERKEIDYVSIRPGYIYGPLKFDYNEKMFFNNLINYNTAIFPNDYNPLFEMIYVEDFINAVRKICINSKEQVYNINSNELLRYKYISEMLKRIIKEPYEEIFMPYKSIIEHGLELPYKNEFNLASSLLFKNEYKDFNWTKTEEGLEKVYKQYKRLYIK